MITYKEEFLNNFVQEEIFNSSSFSILLKGLKKVNFVCKNNKIKESQFLNDVKYICKDGVEYTLTRIINMETNECEGVEMF